MGRSKVSDFVLVYHVPWQNGFLMRMSSSPIFQCFLFPLAWQIDSAVWCKVRKSGAKFCAFENELEEVPWDLFFDLLSYFVLPCCMLWENHPQIFCQHHLGPRKLSREPRNASISVLLFKWWITLKSLLCSSSSTLWREAYGNSFWPMLEFYFRPKSC